MSLPFLHYTALVSPFILTAFWAFVLFRIVRRGKNPRAIVLLGGFALFVAIVAIKIAARQQAIITAEANESISGYLLHTSFYWDGLTRYAQTFLAAAVSTLILWGIFLLVYRFSRGRYFDMSEAGMVALGGLFAGWPGVFIFLAILFILVALAGILHILLARGTLRDRFSIGPMIPVAAIIAIWLGNTLVRFTGLNVISF